MKAALLLSLAVAVTAFPRSHELSGYTFEQYLVHSGKKYADVELPKRKAIFNERLSRIQAHNAEGHSWRMGVNQFTDMTEEERKSYRGYNIAHSAMNRERDLGEYDRVASQALLQGPPVNDVGNVSWIERGMMGGVKNQGTCGSCWAFSSIAVLESRTAIDNGNFGVPTLSPQQLVDCVPNPNECGGNGGCLGATAELAYGYAREMSVQGEYEYPYVDGAGHDTNPNRCPVTSSKASAVKVKSFVRVPSNNQDALLRAVMTGPVVLAVFASPWMDYEGGVFDGCSSHRNNDIDHGVTLTGVGSDGTNQWWEIRNSWGPQWGEGGVIRLIRQGPNPPCYTDYTPADGTVCKKKAYPANLTVCGQCGLLYDPVYPLGAYFNQ